MLKKMIQKKCNIYSGNIYKTKDGVFYINKKNLNEKAEIIEGPIFYKRGFMDLYVKEINSGKIIFTYPLKKLIKFPKKYFVAIDKRRKKFDEPLITLTYSEIAKKNDLNIFTDANKILKLMMNQKSDLVEAYNQEKPSNYKEILNEKMNRNFNFKDEINKIDYKSKLESLKNSVNKLKEKFPKKENTLIDEINNYEEKDNLVIDEINNYDEENNLLINEVNDYEEKEGNITENVNENTEINKIIENEEVIQNNEIIEEKESKNDEFTDDVEGLKVKKYDLCKEHKYVYGFNLKVKPVINLSTNDKSIDQVIAEMVHLNKLNYNVYAVVDDVKLSTRGLKTTEELLEYYNYKKNNVFPTTTNAKIMARANRKLEKQKIKTMI